MIRQQYVQCHKKSLPHPIAIKVISLKMNHIFCNPGSTLLVEYLPDERGSKADILSVQYIG